MICRPPSKGLIAFTGFLSALCLPTLQTALAQPATVAGWSSSSVELANELFGDTGPAAQRSWVVTSDAPSAAKLATHYVSQGTVISAQIARIESVELSEVSARLTAGLSINGLTVTAKVTRLAMTTSLGTRFGVFLETEYSVASTACPSCGVSSMLQPLRLDDLISPLSGWAAYFDNPLLAPVPLIQATPIDCRKACLAKQKFCTDIAKAKLDKKLVICHGGGAAGVLASFACGPAYLLCLMIDGGLLDMCILDGYTDYDLETAVCIADATQCIQGCPTVTVTPGGGSTPHGE